MPITHTIDGHRQRPSFIPRSLPAFTPSHHQPLQLRFPSCAPPGGQEDGVGNSIKMMNNARLVIYSHVSMNSSSSAYNRSIPAPRVSKTFPFHWRWRRGQGWRTECGTRWITWQNGDFPYVKSQRQTNGTAFEWVYASWYTLRIYLYTYVHTHT